MISEKVDHSPWPSCQVVNKRSTTSTNLMQSSAVTKIRVALN